MRIKVLLLLLSWSVFLYVCACMEYTHLMRYWRCLALAFTFSKYNVYLGTLGLAVQIHVMEIISIRIVTPCFRFFVSGVVGQYCCCILSRFYKGRLLVHMYIVHYCIGGIINWVLIGAVTGEYLGQYSWQTGISCLMCMSMFIVLTVPHRNGEQAIVRPLCSNVQHESSGRENTESAGAIILLSFIV